MGSWSEFLVGVDISRIADKAKELDDVLRRSSGDPDGDISEVTVDRLLEREVDDPSLLTEVGIGVVCTLFREPLAGPTLNRFFPGVLGSSGARMVGGFHRPFPSTIALISALTSEVSTMISHRS